MQLEAVTKTFYQEQDCGRIGDGNLLKLETVSNGVGNYIVASTEGWAFDEESLEQFNTEIRKLLNELP